MGPRNRGFSRSIFKTASKSRDYISLIPGVDWSFSPDYALPSKIPIGIAFSANLYSFGTPMHPVDSWERRRPRRHATLRDEKTVIPGGMDRNADEDIGAPTPEN